jgi:flagellar hook-length control protein FliK
VLQALASLDAKPVVADGMPLAAPSLPGAAAALFRIEGDDAGKAGGTAADAAAAAAAAPPRVEATGNGREVAVIRRLETPVGHGRWAESVGHEVRLLVERGVQSATLRLTPEHLGPVEVRIDLVGDKTNVWFGAAHADTRAALTDAIPKLREMFSGAGLMLGDTGVRQDTPGRFGTPGAQPAFGNAADGDAAAPVTASVAVGLNVGLVDAYA